jgi:non-ribosomal peptide synthetase component F
MGRNWQYIVAYLAAVKAGGAYMPLEVVYPKELLGRVLESSKPQVVVTQR